MGAPFSHEIESSVAVMMVDAYLGTGKLVGAAVGGPKALGRVTIDDDTPIC